MKRILQSTKLDCVAACVASLTEIPLTRLPQPWKLCFEEPREWRWYFDLLAGACWRQGWWMNAISEIPIPMLDEPAIYSVKMSGNSRHALIMQAGKVIWDPQGFEWNGKQRVNGKGKLIEPLGITRMRRCSEAPADLRKRYDEAFLPEADREEEEIEIWSPVKLIA